MKTNRLITLIGILVTTGVQAEIVEIDTGFGNGADAYISNRTGDRGTNWGSSDSLLLRNDGNNSGGWHRHSYLRFDLGGVGATVTNVAFDVALTYNTLINNEASIANIWDIEIYGLLDGASGNTWSETGITWNNAPGNNTGSNGFTSDFQLLGTMSIQGVPVGSRISYSSSTLVDFLNADTDGLVTLGLRRVNPVRTATSFILASKENTSYGAPSLSLYTDAIPEPSTIAFVGIFGGGLWFVRRYFPNV